MSNYTDFGRVSDPIVSVTPDQQPAAGALVTYTVTLQSGATFQFQVQNGYNSNLRRSIVSSHQGILDSVTDGDTVNLNRLVKVYTYLQTNPNQLLELILETTGITSSALRLYSRSGTEITDESGRYYIVFSLGDSLAESLYRHHIKLRTEYGGTNAYLCFDHISTISSAYNYASLRDLIGSQNRIVCTGNVMADNGTRTGLMECWFTQSGTSLIINGTNSGGDTFTCGVQDMSDLVSQIG